MTPLIVGCPTCGARAGRRCTNVDEPRTACSPSWILVHWSRAELARHEEKTRIERRRARRIR